ncbi:hypothetical protein BC830DRAFT_819331 [Chytriomyces sp. MP71]|nr:hypothetical protein BC830DRAFT_819331 [Chytriomyces sp. MP71]
MLLRPKTRGAPTSSPLFLAEDTLGVAKAAEEDKGNNDSVSGAPSSEEKGLLQAATELGPSSASDQIKKIETDEALQTIILDSAGHPVQSESAAFPKLMSGTARPIEPTTPSTMRHYSMEQLAISSSRRASLTHTHQQQHMAKPATPKQMSGSAADLSIDRPEREATPSTLLFQSKAVSKAALISSTRREEKPLHATQKRASFGVPSKGSSVAASANASKKNSFRTTPKRHSVVEVLDQVAAATYSAASADKLIISEPYLNLLLLGEAALADNRAIKMIEDDESAKAAVQLSDDFADLGIVDCNSSNSVESKILAVKSNKESSRPSSGWSEFDNAPLEDEVPFSNSALLEEGDIEVASEAEAVITDSAEDDDDTTPIKMHESTAPLHHSASSASVAKIPNSQYDQEGDVQNISQPQPLSLVKDILGGSVALKIYPKQASNLNAADSAPEFAEDEFDYLYNMGISKRPQQPDHSSDEQNENSDLFIRKMEEYNHKSLNEKTGIRNVDSAVTHYEESHKYEASNRNAEDIAESDLAVVTLLPTREPCGSNRLDYDRSANMEDKDRQEDDGTQTELLDQLTGGESLQPTSNVDDICTQIVEVNSSSLENTVKDERAQREKSMEKRKPFYEGNAGFSSQIEPSSEADNETEDNTQMKKTTPLPPIEPNGNRPSSSMTIEPSLSRPLSARVLGAIPTPPRKSRPTSRPISGYQQENAVLVASKRSSLPALVKMASNPSSRPLSGYRPVLNNVAPIENEPSMKETASDGKTTTGSSRDSESALSLQSHTGGHKTSNMVPFSSPISQPLSSVKQASSADRSLEDILAYSYISGTKDTAATSEARGSDIEGVPKTDYDDTGGLDHFEEAPTEYEVVQTALRDAGDELIANATTLGQNSEESLHEIGDDHLGNVGAAAEERKNISQPMIEKVVWPASPANQSAQQIDGDGIETLQSETLNEVIALVESQFVHGGLESIFSGGEKSNEAQRPNKVKDSLQSPQVQNMQKQEGKSPKMNAQKGAVENTSENSVTMDVTSFEASEEVSMVKVETEAGEASEINETSNLLLELEGDETVEKSPNETSAPKQEEDIVGFDLQKPEGGKPFSGERNDEDTIKLIHSSSSVLIQTFEDNDVHTRAEESLPEAEQKSFNAPHVDESTEVASDVTKAVDSELQAIEHHEIETGNAQDESIAGYTWINSSMDHKFVILPHETTKMKDTGTESIIESYSAGQVPENQPVDAEPIDAVLPGMQNIDQESIGRTEASIAAAAPLEQTAIEGEMVPLEPPSESVMSKGPVKFSPFPMDFLIPPIEPNASETVRMDPSEEPANSTTAHLAYSKSSIEEETSATEVAAKKSILAEVPLGAENRATSTTAETASISTKAKSKTQLPSNADAALNGFESFGGRHTIGAEQTSAIENVRANIGANEMNIDEAVQASATRAQHPNAINNDHVQYSEETVFTSSVTDTTGSMATEARSVKPIEFDVARESSIEQPTSMFTENVMVKSAEGRLASAEIEKRDPATIIEIVKLNALKDTDLSDTKKRSQSTQLATYSPMPPGMSNHGSQSTLLKSRKGSLSDSKSQLHYDTETSGTKPSSPRSVRTPQQRQSRTLSGGVKEKEPSLEELVPV